MKELGSNFSEVFHEPSSILLSLSICGEGAGVESAEADLLFLEGMADFCRAASGTASASNTTPTVTEQARKLVISPSRQQPRPQSSEKYNPFQCHDSKQASRCGARGRSAARKNPPPRASLLRFGLATGQRCRIRPPDAAVVEAGGS